MDKYEQEMYNFLIQENNFNTMLKIIENFNMVRENVLHNFWDHVAQRVNFRLENIQGDWKLINPNNKERGDAKLIIYNKNWIGNESHPFVGIAWEKLFGNPYYGVWVDMESNKIHYDIVANSLENLRIEHKYRMDNKWWPLWQYGRLNFSNNSELSNILPTNFDNAVEEYTEKLLGLLSVTDKIIDSIVQ